MSDEDLPSIEWIQQKKEESGKTSIDKSPIPDVFWNLWGFCFWGFLIFRGFQHFQLNDKFNLLGFGTEVVTDPIGWGIGIAFAVLSSFDPASEEKKEEKKKLSEGYFGLPFICPHCGRHLCGYFHRNNATKEEITRLNYCKKVVDGALGSVFTCSHCDNKFVKRSAPPRL